MIFPPKEHGHCFQWGHRCVKWILCFLYFSSIFSMITAHYFYYGNISLMLHLVYTGCETWTARERHNSNSCSPPSVWTLQLFRHASQHPQPNPQSCVHLWYSIFNIQILTVCRIYRIVNSQYEPHCCPLVSDQAPTYQVTSFSALSMVTFKKKKKS